MATSPRPDDGSPHRPDAASEPCVPPPYLAALRRGDPGALEAAWHEHAAVVFAAAVHILRSEPDAREVLQDVFVGLPEKARTYRGRGSFRAWIRRIAVNRALEDHRRRRRRREVALPPAGLAARSPPEAPLGRIALGRALERIPEAERVVFLLKEVEGLSHREIGGALGISPGAAAARLHRARRRLRRWLRSAG